MAEGDPLPHDVAEGVPAGRPGPRIGAELSTGRAPPTMVAALIAWAITLAPVAFGRGTPALATLLAVAALLAGLAGPVVGRTRPRAGRHLGISLFAALATLTWLAGSAAIHPMYLDPVRGIFGAVAWGVFALSWSDRWGPKPEAEPVDPEAPLLLSRATLPALATPIAAIGVAAALVFLTLAWRAREPERALLSQSVALAGAVAVVTAAATVAIARGKRRSPSGGRRLTPVAVRALLLLAAAAVAGAVVAAAR